MADPANPPRGSLRMAIGASLMLCAGLLLVRATGPWPGDAIVWPTAGGILGALLIWGAPGSAPPRRRAWAAHIPRERPHGRVSRRALPREAPARAAALALPEVSRRGLGVAIVLAAGFAFLWANGAVRPAGEAALAAIAVLSGAALIFAPSWRRLARSLAAEKDERIRSQERAEMGAHLHDSVLQTLALIQRSAEDPKRVATLARQQERELRSWLTDGDSGGAQGSLADALQAAATEIEATAQGEVELVAVGDCSLDERAAAVLAAAREAMLNAVKFAPGDAVSVYAELSDGRLQVFVRDRGGGFDLAAVPAERRGVRESIIGRMQRAGGRAAVRSAPGGGTEIEIAIDRRSRA